MNVSNKSKAFHWLLDTLLPHSRYKGEGMEAFMARHLMAGMHQALLVIGVIFALIISDLSWRHFWQFL